VRPPRAGRVEATVAKGDAARLAYYQDLGGLLLEAKAHFSHAGQFQPWLRRQIKAGRFGTGPSAYGRPFGLSLEQKLIEALVVAAVCSQNCVVF